MTLQNWAKNSWLKSHQTSRQEISNLLEIVYRDLNDAKETNLSADWRFNIAYNGALKLCTILMYAEGFMPEKTLPHYRTINALPLILGSDKNDDADYLNVCRTKRNTLEYDYAGGATNADADELIAFTQQLLGEVKEWLKRKHPHLI